MTWSRDLSRRDWLRSAVTASTLAHWSAVAAWDEEGRPPGGDRPEPVFAHRGYYFTLMRMPTFGLEAWKRIIDGVEADGGNLVILWAAGGFRSRKFPQTWRYNRDHENVRRDFLRELIDYAHGLGVRVLLGLTPFGYDGVNRMPLVRPEWAASAPDGRPVPRFGIHCWGRNLCPAREVTQRFMLEYAREMSAEFYPNADGLFLESSDYAACHCPRCGPRFFEHEFQFVRAISEEAWGRDPAATVVVYPHYFSGAVVPGLGVTAARQPLDPRWTLVFTPHSAPVDEALLGRAKGALWWDDAPALRTPAEIRAGARRARAAGCSGYVPSLESFSFIPTEPEEGRQYLVGRRQVPFGFGWLAEGRMPYDQLPARVNRAAYREYTRDPDLGEEEFRAALGAELFGEAATPEAVADALLLQQVFAAERTWCQPAPLADVARVRAMEAAGELTSEKRQAYRAALERVRRVEQAYRGRAEPLAELYRVAKWLADQWAGEQARLLTPSGARTGGRLRRPRSKGFPPAVDTKEMPMRRVSLLLALPPLALLLVPADAPPPQAGRPPAGHAARTEFQGDGLADDAPAIQAALDRDGRVHLPPGTYRLGSRLQVTKSGGGLVGAGPGRTILKPDAALTKGTLLVLNPSNQILTDVELSGFTLDGVADPARINGISVFSSRRVRVHDITAVNLPGLIHLEGVEDFSISEVVAGGLVEFISMNTIRRGVISDVRADGADEGLDFFNCEDVQVVGAVIKGRDPVVIRPEEWSTGVDFSSCRRVTISNCTFTGHRYGIKLKHDTVVGLGAPPVEDVLISDCQIHDFRGAGILLSVVDGRGCRIEGCHIRSERKDTTGVYGFLTPESRLDDLVISDCSIEAPLLGVRFNGYDGAEIRDCRISAGASHAVQVYECSGLTVSGCRLRSAKDSALMLADVADAAVEGCDIAGAAGVWATNCRRPVVRGNRIGPTAGRGVTLEWTSPAGQDGAAREAGFVADENVIRNWGGGSAGNAAIAVSFAGLGGRAWGQGSVSGNRLLLGGEATPNTQYGISFSKGNLESIDGVTVRGNVIHGPYEAVAGADALGPDSAVEGNTFTKNRP